jgi:hypothetical protein
MPKPSCRGPFVNFMPFWISYPVKSPKGLSFVARLSSLSDICVMHKLPFKFWCWMLPRPEALTGLRNCHKRAFTFSLFTPASRPFHFLVGLWWIRTAWLKGPCLIPLHNSVIGLSDDLSILETWILGEKICLPSRIYNENACNSSLSRDHSIYLAIF